MVYLALGLISYGIITFFVIALYCSMFSENLKYHWNWKTGNKILYPYLVSGIIAICCGIWIVCSLL